MFEMANGAYFKKYWWLIVFTIISDLLAVLFWIDFLSGNAITDGKHGLRFVGEAALGHLAGATFLAILLSYYLARSIVELNRNR